MNSSIDPYDQHMSFTSRLKKSPENNNTKFFYSTRETTPINKKLYDMKSLDKWDEEHLTINRPLALMRKKTSILIENSAVANLSLKAQSSKLGAYKGLQANQNVKNFCKQIKEEESSFIAKNIHILKKKFDFDMFRTQSSMSNRIAKTVTFNHTSKFLSQAKEDTHEELYQVGFELGIRKKFAKKKGDKQFNFNDVFEKDEEIHIKNRTLQHHDLELKGKYQKVVNSDYYKKKLVERQKLEATYRKEIIEVSKEIEEQEAQINKLYKKQLEMYNEIEVKKRNYFDNKDTLIIINRQREDLKATRKPSSFKIDYIESTKEIEHFNRLNEQLDELKKEYDDYHILSQWNLVKIKNALMEYKSNLKYLKAHKINITNELKEYYCQLFKKGIDVRSIGLSWILVCLYELGGDVTMNDFPNFLDYPSVNYLIKYSKETIMKKKLNVMLHLFIGNFLCKNNTIEEDNLDANMSISTEQSYIIKEYGALIHQISKNSKSKYFIKNAATQRQDNKQIKKALNSIRQQASSTIISEDLSNNHSTFSNSKVIQRNNHQSFTDETRTDILIIKDNCITSNKREVINICEIIRNLIKKTDNNLNKLKQNHMCYFKNKYDIIKQKGISECVKYDLMYCALFGNYAVI